MVKLIGTDFDGTLLDDNVEVPKENIEYFEKAKRKRIVIVGITGRALSSAKNVLDINMFDYLILNNGSNIYDVTNKQVNYEKSIPVKTIKEITNFMDEKTHQFMFCTYSDYYVYRNYKDQDLSFIREIKDLNELDLPISKMSIYLNDQSNIYSELSLLSNYFTSVRSFVMQDSGKDNKWLVITPKDLNKKESLKVLGKMLNISLEEMVFFGDGLNDLEVIEAVGIGVAMENALESVKEKAKELTISNNEAGVGYYIKHLLEKE